ncbi:MAG: hypothetical protein WCV79_01035 [Candidatus Paceibacterota bacterium]|jgi:hypothetical protein
MNISSPTTGYEVGKHIGGTETFTLYECNLKDDKPGIIKIATASGYNGSLDREAYILQTMRDKAEAIEAEIAHTDPGKGTFGYRHYFPMLVESFIDPDQDGRRISILDLSLDAKKLEELAPITHLLSRERVRVDPKTSVWIAGRLLKLLDFAHRQGITVDINGENILINRDQHFVMIFDWSESTIVTGEVETAVASEEISRAAKEIILALGGDPETGIIPQDDQLEDEDYQKILFGLANGGENNAGEAHRKFYKYVRSVWPSKFHPFTAYPVRSVETTKTTETESE